MAVTSGIYALVFIALERFHSMIYPLQQKTFRSVTSKLILFTCIWSLSLCLQVRSICVKIHHRICTSIIVRARRYNTQHTLSVKGS